MFDFGMQKNLYLVWKTLHKAKLTESYPQECSVKTLEMDSTTKCFFFLASLISDDGISRSLKAEGTDLNLDRNIPSVRIWETTNE